MEIEVIKAVLENNVDLKQKSTSLIVHLREQTHNGLYYELVLCLETLAFKLSVMHTITVHVCTWLNKTSRKGNVCMNAVFLALFFCESFPGGRSESLKILSHWKGHTKKLTWINANYKINHSLLLYCTKRYYDLHGIVSFLEWSVRTITFDI